MIYYLFFLFYFQWFFISVIKNQFAMTCLLLGFFPLSFNIKLFSDEPILIIVSKK
jgi:hypothetical protein